MKRPSTASLLLISILGAGFVILLAVPRSWFTADNTPRAAVDLSTIPPSWKATTAPFITEPENSAAITLASNSGKSIASYICPSSLELRSDPVKLRQCLDTMDLAVKQAVAELEDVVPQRMTSSNGIHGWWLFELAEGRRVARSSYDNRRTANVLQFDIDGDGEFEVAHFAIDSEPTPSLIVYDVHATGLGEYARFDDNRDGSFDSEEIFHFNDSLRWWAGAVPGAPRGLSLQGFLPNPIPFAFPFFYGF